MSQNVTLKGRKSKLIELIQLLSGSSCRAATTPPASSGRLSQTRDRTPLSGSPRRWTPRYSSQRDEFYHPEGDERHFFIGSSCRAATTPPASSGRLSQTRDRTRLPEWLVAPLDAPLLVAARRVLPS